jgi:hypothetical protein
MARPGISSRHVDDVASFTYDPRVEGDFQLELPDTSPIDKLAGHPDRVRGKDPDGA